MQINIQASKQRKILTPPVIDIELLALDLNRCTRCVGTLDNIESAVDIVRPALDALGAQMNLRKLIIESEEQVLQYELVTSPTVRINGRDIAFETWESQCESCTDISGCDEGTNCRVWLYQGQEYTEAPVGLVVEAVLREIFGGHSDPVGATPAYRGVPENLRGFFRSKAAVRPPWQSCCSTAEQETCCEPTEKSACCDASEPDTCGCQ